jgi:hypothetical protein
MNPPAVVNVGLAPPPRGIGPRLTLAGCRFLLLLFVSFTLVGCGLGSKGVKVSGKVVLPKNTQILPDDDFFVSLTAIDPPHTETAQIDQNDLTFVMNGADRHGVPPGKYKVSVDCKPYRGQDGTVYRKHKAELDTVFSKFNGKKNVLPDVEIPSGSAVSLTIDLEQKTVTK